MKSYYGKAFVSNDNEMFKEFNIVGNPANIYIIDDDESITQEEKCSIGVRDGKNDIPMAVFVKKVKNTDNCFDISYYQPSGIQAYICGHGTLIASKVLHDVYNLNNINFYYDLGVYDIRGGDKPKNNLIEASVDDTGKVMLKMDSYHYELIDKYDENINNLIYLLDIKKDDIVDVIKGIEFFDLTFVLKSCECLRTRKPQFKKMIPILKEMNIRNVCFTAQSDLEKFDFESRVFCPHDDLNEDKVCGSSNLTITKYWNNKIHKNEFQILFPYRMMSEEKLIGGVQYTKIMNDIIYIGGYCSNY